MTDDHQSLTIRRDICRKIVNTVSAPAAIGPYNQVLHGIFSQLHDESKLFHKVFFLCNPAYSQTYELYIEY